MRWEVLGKGVGLEVEEEIVVVLHNPAPWGWLSLTPALRREYSIQYVVLTEKAQS